MPSANDKAKKHCKQKAKQDQELNALVEKRTQELFQAHMRILMESKSLYRHVHSPIDSSEELLKKRFIKWSIVTIADSIWRISG